MAAQNLSQLDRPKRTALLVGDFDGTEVSHLRTEIRRRYDLGFVHRKSLDKIRDTDANLVGAFVMVAYYDSSYLRQLQKYCEKNGPLFIYAFDHDYSEYKLKESAKLTYIRYRRFSRNMETLIAVFGKFAADIRNLDATLDDTHQLRNVEFCSLGARIENAALAIRSLNLNSTSDIISELEELAKFLCDPAIGSETRFYPRHEAKRALTVLAKLYDHIENSRMTAIIISGAVTAVVADAGWSAVACQTVCLASWNGKDAFMNALARLPSFAGPRSKKPNTELQYTEDFAIRPQ